MTEPSTLSESLFRVKKYRNTWMKEKKRMRIREYQKQFKHRKTVIVERER